MAKLMTPETFRLEDKHAVPCTEGEWLKQMQDTKSRIVSKNHCFHVTVSTVFVGYDVSLSPEENAKKYRKIQWENNAPWAFETCVFGWPMNYWFDYQDRYRSWEDAKQGHEKMVEIVRRKINGIIWKLTTLTALSALAVKFFMLAG